MVKGSVGGGVSEGGGGSVVLGGGVSVGGWGVVEGSITGEVLVGVGTMGKVALGVTPCGRVGVGVSVICASVGVGGEHSRAALSRFS